MFDSRFEDLRRIGQWKRIVFDLDRSFWLEELSGKEVNVLKFDSDRKGCCKLVINLSVDLVKILLNVQSSWNTVYFVSSSTRRYLLVGLVVAWNKGTKWICLRSNSTLVKAVDWLIDWLQIIIICCLFSFIIINDHAVR